MHNLEEGKMKKFSISLAAVTVAMTCILGMTSKTFADTKDKDIIADSVRDKSKLFFLRSAPPGVLRGSGWFYSNTTPMILENSSNRWPLHVALFLSKKIESNKIDLRFYRINEKKREREFVATLEQFFNTATRSVYLLVTLRNELPYGPGDYEVEALDGGTKLASGRLKLEENSASKEARKKAENVGRGPLTFNLPNKPTENKDAPPFDRKAARKSLDAVIYDNCQIPNGGTGKAALYIKFSSNDGKVLSTKFAKEPSPYDEKVARCITTKFSREVKIPPFLGKDKTIQYNIELEP